MSEQPVNGSNEDETTEKFPEPKLIETNTMISEMSVEPNDSSESENKYTTTKDVRDSKFIESEMTTSEKCVETAADIEENFKDPKISQNLYSLPKLFQDELKGKPITLSSIKIPTVEEALKAFQILKSFLQSKTNARDLFDALNQIEKFCLQDKLEHQMSNRIQVKIEKPDYCYYDDDGEDDNDFEPICQLDEKIEHLKEKIQDLNENSSISIYRNPVKLEQPDPDELEDILDDNKFFDKDLNLIKMEKHMSIKIENTSYQDYEYHSVFQRSNGVPKTKKSKKGSMNIKCVLCDTNFTTKSSLDAHVQAKHFKGLKTFQCNFCSHSFSFERYLKLHIEAVHNSKPKVFRCDICATTFLVKEELKTHMNAIHKGEKNYQCDECGMEFGLKTALSSHKSKVHKKDKKEIKCDLCDRLFSCKTSLRVHHDRVHKGLKNFMCAECGDAFSTKSDMKRHSDRVHKGLKNYQCESCDKKFFSKSHLNTHTDIVHKGLRNFQCESCGKDFTQRKHMKRHYDSVHRGVRFPCTLCDKAFSQKNDLKRHTDAVHKSLLMPLIDVLSR